MCLGKTVGCICVLDESVIGGLSLLLMAGQHSAATTAVTSPVLASDHHSADASERPMDLSQTGANCKISSNTTAVNVTQSCHLPVCSTSDTANACPPTFVCSRNPVSSSVSLTFPLVHDTQHISSMSSLPHSSMCKVFTIPAGTADQNSVIHGILPSSGGYLVGFNTRTSSHFVESPKEKIDSGDTGVGSSSGVQYPKTKKQKAADSKLLTSSLANSVSTPMVDGDISRYRALTFGEIQEQLITKVVESGSLSEILHNERRCLTSASEHHATGISTGKLPSGPFPNCRSSQPQFRPCLAAEIVSSEHRSPQKAASLSTSAVSSPVKEKTHTSTIQGLEFHDDFVDVL